MIPPDDPEILARVAGTLGAQVAVAENVPIEQADRIVAAVFETLGLKFGEIVETPVRQTLLSVLPSSVLAD